MQLRHGYGACPQYFGDATQLRWRHHSYGVWLVDAVLCGHVLKFHIQDTRQLVSCILYVKFQHVDISSRCNQRSRHHHTLPKHTHTQWHTRTHTRIHTHTHTHTHPNIQNKNRVTEQQSSRMHYKSVISTFNLPIDGWTITFEMRPTIWVT